MVGTEVLGQRCRVNEEELLGPSDGSYRLSNSQPRGPVKSLHVDLLKNLTRDCSLQEVLGVLIRALALQLQGLELGQCNRSVFFFLSNLRLDYILSYHT